MINQLLTQLCDNATLTVSIDRCVRLACGTSSCQVHHTQTMWCLVVGAHPEHFHGDSTHLRDIRFNVML